MTRQEILSIRALRNRSERREQQRFVVEGMKGIAELVESQQKLERIYCLAAMHDALPVELRTVTEIISSKEMERISQMSTPPGVLAVVGLPIHSAQDVWGAIQASPARFGLVAANIQDPGNLGTLIRSADWFGFGGVFLTGNATDPWSTKCVQASMGSIFRVPVAPLDLRALPSTVAHYHLELTGVPHHSVSWEPGLIWVGSESHGFESVELPMQSTAVHIPALGAAESLNAGVAGSIVCAEITRGMRP